MTWVWLCLAVLAVAVVGLTALLVCAFRAINAVLRQSFDEVAEDLAAKPSMVSLEPRLAHLEEVAGGLTARLDRLEEAVGYLNDAASIHERIVRLLDQRQPPKGQ